MKKLLCCILLILALVFALVSCGDGEPTVSVNDDGYVVVNGVATEIIAHKDDVITVDDDGYVVVNGTKTEHKIHTTDEISVNTEGFVVVNGVTTEIVADKDDVITVDDDGYVVVNGVKTEYEIKNKNHSFCEWKLYNEDETNCEKKLYYRICSDCSSIEWKDGRPEDHTFQTVTTVATCISGGYDTKTCTVCNKIIICNETPVSSTNHSFGDWYESIKVTCTTDGKDERTCVCGTKETRIVPALGDAHTPVVDEAVAPTYTTRGKTEGSHCSICQTIIVPQQDISTIWNGGITEPTSLVLIEGVYYYEINSAEELAFLSTASNEWCNYNYILKCNIVLNAKIEYEQDGMLISDPTQLHEWVPIGGKSASGGWWKGCFDGNGYSISGVYCANQSDYSNGLFGMCGTVKNLSLLNSYIKGSRYVGGIAGGPDLVHNCSFSGIVVNTYSVHGGSVGGICGSGKATDCTNFGTIISNYAVNIGGIIGSGTVINGINHGVVISNGTKSKCGGISGRSSVIENCENYGNVSGTDYVGGIVGLLGDGLGPGRCLNCINYGEVSGNNFVGGVAGKIATNSINAYIVNIPVKGCKNNANIAGVEYVGGICGFNDCTIENSLNIGNIVGDTKVGGIAGFSNMYFGEAEIKNCFYLKNSSVNTNIVGIGNAEDIVGNAEAKDEKFFVME